MSQHFLLSSKARTISVRKIASMSDNECYEYFKSIRWSGNKGNPVCPIRYVIIDRILTDFIEKVLCGCYIIPEYYIRM